MRRLLPWQITKSGNDGSLLRRCVTRFWARDMNNTSKGDRACYSSASTLVKRSRSSAALARVITTAVW
jgi:hypothetical protein